MWARCSGVGNEGTNNSNNNKDTDRVILRASTWVELSAAADEFVHVSDDLEPASARGVVVVLCLSNRAETMATVGCFSIAGWRGGTQSLIKRLGKGFFLISP